MGNIWAVIKAIPAILDGISAVVNTISEWIEKRRKAKRHDEIETQSKNPNRQNAARNANDIFRKL